MKFLVPLILSALSVGATTNNFNTLSCLEADDVDYNKDYFPHKATPEFSAHWAIEYHNTYKILKNSHTDTSWLLYQCGTTPPAEEAGKHQGSFSVPLQDGIVLGSSTDLTHIEQLGIRRQLKGFLGTMYTESPCFKTLNNEGLIEKLDATNMDAFIAEHPNVAIIKSSGDEPNTIHVSKQNEAESKDIFEWHKVFGALFNLESIANREFDESSARFDCVADNASYLATKRRRSLSAEFEEAMVRAPIKKVESVPRRGLNEKPKVLWAGFTNYGGVGYNEDAWDVGRCDVKNNYYCEFATLCNTELLHSNDGSIKAGPVGDDMHFNYTDFLEFGKDADYWFYTGQNWDSTIAAHPELKEFKSVKNNQVYDFMKHGTNWFEHRIGEYDVVLQDYCEAVGYNDDVAIPHERMFFRKLLPESEKEPVGNLGTCPAGYVDMPWQTRASTCTSLRPKVVEEDNDSEDHDDEDHDDHDGHDHSSSAATLKKGATAVIAALSLMSMV